MYIYNCPRKNAQEPDISMLLVPPKWPLGCVDFTVGSPRLKAFMPWKRPRFNES